jgi:hypothetical protein
MRSAARRTLILSKPRTVSAAHDVAAAARHIIMQALSRFGGLVVSVLFVGVTLSAQMTVTLTTAPAGDAQYEWNSRYGGDGYSGVGDNSVQASTSFYAGVPSDTQYTVGIFMIPLGPIAGYDVLSATLKVNSTGFSTWYYYGSASLGWLDTSSVSALTGNVVTDGLGPLAKARPTGWVLYNSDVPGTEAAGQFTFDVATYLQQDIDAGRAYSTFVLSASRDTAGAIAAAESGFGPSVTAVAIPEPAASAVGLGAIAVAVALWRRRRTR